MAMTSFLLLDEARRELGRAFDVAGLGPVETPFRVIANWRGARLRAYHPRKSTTGLPASARSTRA